MSRAPRGRRRYVDDWLDLASFVVVVTLLACTLAAAALLMAVRLFG